MWHVSTGTDMPHVSFTMNPSLEMDPKLVALAMAELLDTMEFHSDDDSLRGVIPDAEQYLIDFAPDENDYDRRTWELRNQVMRAFLDFVRYHHNGAISSCKNRLLFTDQEMTPIKSV